MRLGARSARGILADATMTASADAEAAQLAVVAARTGGSIKKILTTMRFKARGRSVVTAFYCTSDQEIPGKFWCQAAPAKSGAESRPKRTNSRGSTVTKANADKAFRSSLDMLNEEDRHAYGAFDALVDDIVGMFAKAGVPGFRRKPLRVAAVCRTAMSAGWRDTFAKALPKLQPKRARIVSIAVRDPSAEAAAVVTKSFHALNHDSRLTAEARGQIMLGLSGLATKAFGQSGQVSDRLDQVRRAIAMLERAKAQHHIDQIDPLVEKIKEAVARGETEPSDLLVLESRLHEIRRRLEEHTGHAKE